jgi:hypothetical protein
MLLAIVCALSERVILPFEMNPALKTRRVFGIPHEKLFMTNRTDNDGARRLNCSRCGVEFGCNPRGSCWCKEQTLRLPMPVAGEDCLCPECLRKEAQKGAQPSLRA